MPVVVQYTANIGPDEYDEVVSNIRFHDDLPDGLIMHAAAVTRDGRIRVVEIWQAREAHDRFLETRGCPGLLDVVGEPRPPGGRTEVLQLHSLVRPVGSSPATRSS